MKVEGDRVRLSHILESARLISDWIRGVTKERFFEDIMLQEAVIRRLEVMTEQERSDRTTRLPGRNSLPQLSGRCRSWRAECAGGRIEDDFLTRKGIYDLHFAIILPGVQVFRPDHSAIQCLSATNNHRVPK